MEDVGTIEEVRRSRGQLCFEWKIERFFTLIHYRHLESPLILFNDGSWFLAVLPNSDWLELSLYIFDKGTPVALEITVCVRGSMGEEYKEEREVESSGFRGWKVWDRDSAPKMADLRSGLLLEDGALVIRCEMKIEAGAMEELQGSLQRFYESGEGCDVVMKVQGKEFPAHKCILQMRSPVFRAMFDHNMLERAQNTINIEDLDQDAFPSFLEHIYTGSVGTISTSNVFSLFTAANKYDFQALKRECSRFMRRNMTVTSVCDVIRIAVKHSKKELMEHASEFFCSNSSVIVNTPEWQIFSEENPTVGNELVMKALSEHENIYGGRY